MVYKLKLEWFLRAHDKPIVAPANGYGSSFLKSATQTADFVRFTVNQVLKISDITKIGARGWFEDPSYALGGF